MESERTVQVGKALYGGGFAIGGGEALPFVLPVELVKIDAAGVVQVVEASGQRVSPGCVHFGVCGGCQYQHAAYPEQLRLKQGILRDLLAAEGLTGLPEAALHAAEPWDYRNRIRLRVREQDGSVQAGYSRRGTNEFLPVRMCPIAAPVLWRVAESLMNLGTSDPVCRRWLGLVSEVELFASGDQARLQAQFFLRSAAAPREQGYGFAAFCERLKGEIPELVGAGAAVDPELARRVRKAWDGAAWGAAGLAYEVAGRSYWVGRGAFFQVNRFMVERLVELVAGGRSGRLAWDLYAGVGLFSRPLAERFATVVAAEGGEAAAASLASGARGGSIHPVWSGILDFLRARVIERERPELIVLDPPRAGLGVEGCGLISRIGAAEVVYVSCDPTTLARDLSVLLAGGYAVLKLDLVDLFPQTFHMETVVSLRRR